MYTRHKYKEPKESADWQKTPDPIGTKKWDGGAYFMQVGPTGSLTFLSRRPSVKGGFPDKTDRLPHIANSVLPQYAGNVYHVELVHTGKTKSNKDSHSTASGLLNSLPARSIDEQERLGPLRAVLLDTIGSSFKTYGEKRKHLEEVAAAIGKPEVFFVPEAKIGIAAINKEIERTKASGEEGVIITSLTKPESENVRFKIKHRNLFNLKVVGVTQEVDIYGNKKDSAGALTVEDATGRIVADVGTGLTRDLRKEIWANPKAWIGKYIQVEGMPPTGSSNRKLRHPVYNGDADGELDVVE